MDLSHEILFSLPVDLDPARAIEFVRDVPRSLRTADFLAELQVVTSTPPVVSAAIPVSAALFGQRELPFRSQLHRTEAGAKLVPIEFDYDGPGWAHVAGEATVTPAGKGSRLDYTFHITVHVRLPESDHWGAQALVKMIEYTARTVLQKVMNRLPTAVAAAAGLEAAEPVASAQSLVATATADTDVVVP
jgi:carbon monoxide dehydrogenase subunit G